MGNPEPLHRLPDLPAVNAGRSAVLPAHLPEDLHRSSGAAVWHEPEQSQPVDPCSAASVARGAARSRRPLPHGFGAPPGCLGGAARGRAAAGACALPSLCLQSWAGLPLLLMTERNGAFPRTLLNRRSVTVARKK